MNDLPESRVGLVYDDFYKFSTSLGVILIILSVYIVADLIPRATYPSPFVFNANTILITIIAFTLLVLIVVGIIIGGYGFFQWKKRDEERDDWIREKRQMEREKHQMEKEKHQDSMYSSRRPQMKKEGEELEETFIKEL
ncbi:MAG: hypothetical protein ABH834_03600 [Candidatus Altiarchaeota archaeon]